MVKEKGTKRNPYNTTQKTGD